MSRSKEKPQTLPTLFGIVHTARVADRIFAETFARHDLAAGQFGVLASVNDAPGITQAEIARVLHVRPQTVTRPTATLQDKGLIISDRASRRGRPGPLFITNRGRRALDRTWPDVEAINNPARLGLTAADAEELARLLTAVRNRLEG